MKKFIILMVMMLAGVSFGADANLMKYVSILPPNASTNLSVTGSTIDIAAYKGNATLLVYTGTSSSITNTITVTFQHSNASNFASPSTVTNLAGVAGVLTESCTATVADTENLQSFPIDLARCHRYVRSIFTTTASDAYIPVSVTLVAPMKAE